MQNHVALEIAAGPHMPQVQLMHFGQAQESSLEVGLGSVGASPRLASARRRSARCKGLSMERMEDARRLTGARCRGSALGVGYGTGSML